MNRIIGASLSLLILWVTLSISTAQTLPELVRPDFIQITPADEPYQVTITGTEGALPARLQVAIRNQNTGATVYAQGDNTGAFTATIDGTPYAPYLIAVAPVINDATRRANALPDTPVVFIQQSPDDRDEQPARFDLGGLLSRGASVWTASGAIEKRVLSAGDTTIVSLDVTHNQPFNDGIRALTMYGEISLQSLATPDAPLIPVGMSETDLLRYDSNGAANFRLIIPITLPDDLPAGLYQPIFQGWTRTGDSDRFDWYDNRFFSTTGNGESGTSQTKVPIIIQVDTPAPVPADFSLFGLVDGQQTIRTAGAYQLFAEWLTPHVSLDTARSNLTLTITLPDNLPAEPRRIATERIVIMDNRIGFYADETAPDVTFNTYGDYQLTLRGELIDRYGNAYPVDQSFTVTIAEPLAILPHTLAGAPLIAGQGYAGGVRIVPPIPAQVTIDTQFTLPEGDSIAEHRDTLTADSHGHASLTRSTPDESGTYQRTLTARYTDADGRLWAGMMTTAGVVTLPDTPAGYGERGVVGYDRQQQAWFDTAVYPPDAPLTAPNVYFPFFSGDTAFMPDTDNTALTPALFTNTGDILTTVTRPDSIIAQGTPADTVNTTDTISGGSLANGDVLLNFGGTISGEMVSGYASTTVITAGDTARVVPPLIGNLVTDGNRSYEALFIATSAGAGQVIDTSTVTLAGQIVPPLPLELAIQLTAPDGQISRYTPDVNLFGGVQPVTFDDLSAGIYQVTVDLRANTITSAGQVTRALNGGVYGAGNTYALYVTSDDEPLITNRQPDENLFAGQAQSLVVNVPEGWTSARAHVTATSTAGYVLEQAEIPLFSNRATYQYVPQALTRRFPNLEITGSGTDNGDTVIITLAIEGTTADGQRGLRVRTFTLLHDRLLTGFP